MLTNEMLVKYEELTFDNCHGVLLEEIARDFNLFEYEEIFKSINRIHSIEGSILHDVLQVRSRVSKEMLEALKQILNGEDYEEMKLLI